jgi:hypothetical protein
MKNAWKGLIVGALIGMVGGSAMDMASGARRKAAEVAHDVMDVAHDVIDKAPSAAKAATHKAADVLQANDVPETVRDVALQVGDSQVAKKAKRVAGQVAAGLGTDANGLT